jgi:hypothetical protein
MNYFPHDVPMNIGQTVFIRDGWHNGTRVTNTGKNFVFESLDRQSTQNAERCILVELAPPVYDEETGQEISNWETAIPDNAPYGVDLEGKGYALIGMKFYQYLDERVGTILWDSWNGI